MDPQTAEGRTVAAIAHHFTEALLIALEAAQDLRNAPPAPVVEPTPPTAQRAPGALLTVEDVAEALAVSPKTVRNWRLRRIAGDRADILARVAGSWVGYYGDDHTRTLCKALLEIPGALDWVGHGRARRETGSHGAPMVRP